MKKKLKTLLAIEFSSKLEKNLNEISYLVFRVGFALLIMTHGWPKLMGYSQRAETFPDPTGFLGSGLALSLTILTEFFGGLLIALGLFTRLSAFSLVTTMFIIVFIFHGDDPFKKQEMGILYGLAFLVILLAGGRKWSLDQWVKKRF